MAKTTSAKKGGTKAKTTAASARTKTRAKTASAKTTAKTTRKTAAKKAAPKKTAKKSVKRTLAPKVNEVAKYDKLNLWNKVLVVVYLLQAMALVALANAKHFSVTTTYQAVDPLASSGGEPVLVNASRTLFDINVVYALVAMLGAALVARFVVATYQRTRYEADLKNRMSRIRWIELEVVGGILAVLAAMLVGISDISSLIMIFVLAEIAAISGLVIEQRGASLTNMTIGLKALVLPLAAVVIYLVGSSVYGHTNTSLATYSVVGTIAAAFVLLGANLYASTRKLGRWADYLFAEKAYLLLTAVAITAVVGQVFLSLLQS